MKYKTKVTFLSALVFLLALAYVLGLVSDPARRGSRAFALLDGKLAGLADTVEISGPAGGAVLNRVNNIWVFRDGPTEYPVKQGRVEDLFTALSRKEAYHHQAASSGGMERLGLAGPGMSRIIIRGGAGLPLLDLFLGRGDALRRDVYFRIAGRDGVYSGEDRLTVFTDTSPASWYDLRLFRGGIDISLIQQARISLSGTAPLMFRRSGSGWLIPGDETASLDSSRVEAWLRSVAEARGGDFSAEQPDTVEGSITLWLGDGTACTVEAGPAGELKHRSVSVSGADLAYVFPEPVFNSLFRERGYFLKTPGET